MRTTAQQEMNTPASVTTGDFVWHELRTTDAKGAAAFYTHVIGWKTKDSGDPAGVPYKLFSVGGLHTAGLLELDQPMLDGGMTPAWAAFIGATDWDAGAQRLDQAG